MLELLLEGNLTEQIELAFSQFTELKVKEDVLDECQALLLQRIRQRFLQQVAPDGTPWIPSMAAQRRNFNGGTLFDTGKLFHSLQAMLPEELERTIGTDVFYGAHHQFGTGKLPVREFLGYSHEDVELIEKLVLRRLLESVNE